MKFTLMLIFLLSFASVHSMAAQKDDSCPNALPERLVVGQLGRVTPGSSNNVRAEPSRNADLVGQIPGGSEFTVLEGPRCVDDLVWWQVDFGGLVGWTVEGADGEYWLEPLDPSTVEGCISNLTIGEQAERTSHWQGAIYPDPSWRNPQLGEIPEWTRFDVIGGPVCDESAVWVEVHYDGITGWLMALAKRSLFECYSCPEDSIYILARRPLNPLQVVELAPGENPFQVQESPTFAPDAITLNNVDQVVTLQVLGEGAPRGFAWSNDESHIAISGSDHIRIYRINQLNTPRHVITGFEGLVNRGQYSPDGRFLVAGDQAGMVYIWDATDYQRIARMEHDGAVNATVFSHDSEMLAVGGTDGITLWSLSNPAQPTILYEFPIISSGQLGFSPDNSYLVHVAMTRINIFRLDTGETFLSESLLNDAQITDDRWAISPDGNCVSVLIEDQVGEGGYSSSYGVRSWSLATDEVDCINHSLIKIDYTAYESVSSVNMVYSPTGKSIFISIGNEQWNLTASRRSEYPPHFQFQNVRTLAYHPTDLLLATGTTTGEIRLYWQGELAGVLYGINGHVEDLQFSPEGNYLAASGWDNSIRVWRIEDQQRLGSVVYQRFGSMIIPGTDESTVFSDTHVWDLSTGQPTPLPALPDGERLQIRPDGNFVIYNRETKTYGIYNPDNNQFISEFTLESPAFSHTISQDGRRLAYGLKDRYESQSLHVIDLDSVRLIQHWEHLFEQPSQLLFSPDNRFMLVYESGRSDGHNHSLLLFEVESGDLIVHIPLPEGSYYITGQDIAYSPDGTRITWVSSELIDRTPVYTLHIFDLPSQQEIVTVELPSFGGNIQFNVDGSLIAFRSNGVIHLLDSTTGQEIRTLEGYLGNILQIRFSRDGSRLYSTAADSQLRVWGIAP